MNKHVLLNQQVNFTKNDASKRGRLSRFSIQNSFLKLFFNFFLKSVNIIIFTIIVLYYINYDL